MPLDIGLGIIGAILFSYFSGGEISFTLLALGILFALLPDVDFIFRLSSGKKADRFSHEHRDLFHYPLFYVSIGFLVLGVFSWPYAVFFVLLSLAHFLHDSMGTGWGLQWLYPFSKKYFKFFSMRNGNLGLGMASWLPDEQAEVASIKGDDNWIKNIYLTINPISVTEYGVLVLAIVLYLLLK